MRHSSGGLLLPASIRMTVLQIYPVLLAGEGHCQTVVLYALHVACMQVENSGQIMTCSDWLTPRLGCYDLC